MKKENKSKILYIFFSMVVVLVIFTVIIAGVLKISDADFYSPAINSVAYNFIEKQSEADVVEVIHNMNSIGMSREDATLESIAESVNQSIAESISEYIRESEELSVEESVQQSIAQSIAESVQQSIAQSIAESVQQSIADREAAVEAALSRGELQKGEVMMASSSSIPLIRKLYENTIVIGDSRAKGIVDNGILTDNEVTYFGGASVGTLYDTTRKAALRMRKKALFIVGLNDCGWYHGNSARFKADYINLIQTYLNINPDCKIYLQEILPVQEYGRYAWSMMDYIPEFNTAIQEICSEYGYVYVSATEYCLPKYVNSRDGAHFGFQFYMLWAQTMANQMGLWEDI